MKNLKIVVIGMVASLMFSCVKEKTPDPALAECPDTISFNQSVLPLITSKCSSCHGNGGTPPALTDHSQISNSISISLVRMKETGGALMPLGGPAVADSLIKKIECWVAQGKQNN